ncbi:Hypothetical protein SMAX5B_019047 [Scophthalmus maximus]|uniref:Uncharacterized protein n=1 Tax=Scophthalmus maximus TaxID=52904 RepID=A0A2U9C7J8_SCOMX|nr:Hypothetical protein SMAX5B_019047 [Scophthalmus maximus]
MRYCANHYGTPRGEQPSQVISPGPAALSRELRSYEGRQGGKEQGDEVKSSPEFICTQVMLRLNNKPY